MNKKPLTKRQLQAQTVISQTSAISALISLNVAMKNIDTLVQMKLEGQRKGIDEAIKILSLEHKEKIKMYNKIGNKGLINILTEIHKEEIKLLNNIKETTK